MGKLHRIRKAYSRLDGDRREDIDQKARYRYYAFYVYKGKLTSYYGRHRYYSYIRKLSTNS